MDTSYDFITLACFAIKNQVSCFWDRGAKPCNHVFKVGGPIPWSRVLLPFYKKKLDRFAQFGAVCYIITLYSSKSYVKSWGGPDPRPIVVAPMFWNTVCATYWHGLQHITTCIRYQATYKSDRPNCNQFFVIYVQSTDAKTFHILTYFLHMWQHQLYNKDND